MASFLFYDVNYGAIFNSACLGERGRCFRAPALSTAELKTFVLSTEALQHKQSSSYPVLDLFS